MRDLRFPVWVALCVSILSPALAHADVSLDFTQVDYYQDGSLGSGVQDSPWGEFMVTYDPTSALQWVNVVANPGSSSESWIVQNHPLLPTDLLGGGDPFSSTALFDLGVSGGTDVTSLNVLYTISSAPLVSAPVAGATATADVGTAQNIINSGVPSGIAALNAPGAGGIVWGAPFVNVEAGFRQGLPNVVQELNFCGPGAAANSLQWLMAANGAPLAQTLAETQNELAQNMGNTNTGNWDDAEVQGKLQYLLEHNVSNVEIHYVGGVQLPTGGNYVEPNGNGTARNDGAVTWEWLQSEFEKGQDIELMTNTHWVVMSGFLSWGDIHLVQYRDDPFQHGAATTNDETNLINNRYTWSYFNNGFVNIGNGNERLGSAVAESVVPEPSTFGLMGLGLLAAARARRRRLT